MKKNVITAKRWSGERLETFIINRDTVEHLHRYAVAQEYVVDKRVLDIACGEGYGASILSEKAAFVSGVDVDIEVINRAKVKYQKQNLEFLQGDACKIPFEDDYFDLVVSFETIEHHDKHEEMLTELKRVLKSSGIIIISTPDKHYYSDARSFNNKFHVKELYKDEFKSLVNNFFVKQQILVQRYLDGISLISNDKESPLLFSGNFRNIKLENPDPLYVIVIASDLFFKEQELSIYSGNALLNQEESKKWEMKIKHVYESNSYKIGSKLLFPLKFLRKFF